VCKSVDIHYAKRSTFGSFLMGMLLNADALRCFSCQCLFYRQTAAEDETEPEKPVH
jgi:hypothetical protein